MTTELTVGLPVRVIGGKFNGFEGVVMKLCDTVGSILISFEGQRTEIIIDDLKWLTALSDWKAGKNKTELDLRGHGGETT